MSTPTAITYAAPGRARGDIVLVGNFEGEALDLSRATPAAANASVPRRWRGRRQQLLDLPVDGGQLLSLHGLGARKAFDARSLRQFLRRAVQHAQTQGGRNLVVVLPDHEETHGAGPASRIGLLLATCGYRFEAFRSEPSSSAAPRRIQVVPPESEEEVYRPRLREVAAVAAGVVLARDLGNTPPNVATPQWMASRARRLGREWGARVVVLAPTELRRRGMGGLLAVGGGSANPPRMVRMRWGRRGPRLALVGKGVTFDSGGISIKPASSMEEMKYDKCGACSVLGALAAIVALDLPLRVSAYLPLAENMPAAAAYRPSDIVRCYNGKTVEVHNTDAEGRMILADALAWAVEDEPEVLVELSTLTGAAVVALGESGAALYTPADDLAAALLEAAAEAGERLWRMPLWPEFVEQIKGNHGDLKNVGGRWGGANTAAAFLSQFVGETSRWAHVDVAGPAYAKQEPDGQSATGFGVATLVRWCSSLA